MTTIHFKRIWLGKPTYSTCFAVTSHGFLTGSNRAVDLQACPIPSAWHRTSKRSWRRKPNAGAEVEHRKAQGLDTLWWCQNSYGKSPFFMGKSTISMVIFNSYVSHYQRVHWILLVGYRIYMWTMVNINNHFLNGVTLHWIKLWQLKGTSASVTEMQQRHGEHSPLMVGSGRHFSGVSRCRCTAPPQNIVSTEEHTTPGLSSFTAKFVTWDSDFYHLLN